MLLANLVLVLIIVVCAAYHYSKGTVLGSFATLVVAVIAGIVAFAYFESLAQFFALANLLGKLFSLGESKTRFAHLGQPLCFALLFVLFFAVLRVISGRLVRERISFGELGDQVLRTVWGALLGYFLAGLLLTALAMAPLPKKYPYERFEQTTPNPDKPNRVFLNPDGFVTGLFALTSNGSLQGKRSFGVLHTDFLNQVFLNRHKIADDISTFSPLNEILVPEKNGAWFAPPDLKDSGGQAVSTKSGHAVMVVRVGLKVDFLESKKGFTLSQLRLICQPKIETRGQFKGVAEDFYPMGYISAPQVFEKKRFDEIIRVERSDFDSEVKTDTFKGNVRWIDFVFDIPSNYMPVLVEFKQNSIAEVPAPVSGDQIPRTKPFSMQKEAKEDKKKEQKK